MSEKTWELTATVFVFSPGLDRILLVRRDKEPLIGQWLPPGGHVEPLERPDDAAVREVAEETGLQIALIDARPDLPHAFDTVTSRVIQPHHIQIEPIDARHNHLDLIYFACCDPFREPTETAARWWTVQDVLASDLIPANVSETARLWLSPPQHSTDTHRLLLAKGQDGVSGESYDYPE